MRHVARPKIDPVPLEAVRASLRDWLVSLLLWLVETFERTTKKNGARADTWLGKALIALKRELDLDLRLAVRDLRMLLIAHAFARLPTFLGCAFQPAHRPGGRAPHLRRAARRNSVKRRFVGGALKGMQAGSLRERTERLQAALDNLAPLIDAVLKQMTRMWLRPSWPGLILTYARDALNSLASPRALAADTS
jgi:hypothetical protein